MHRLYSSVGDQKVVFEEISTRSFQKQAFHHQQMVRGRVNFDFTIRIFCNFLTMISTFFGSFGFNGFCYIFMKIIDFFIQIVQKIIKMMKKHTKNQNHNLHFFDFPTPLILQKTIIFIFSNFSTFFAFFYQKLSFFINFASNHDVTPCNVTP